MPEVESQHYASVIREMIRHENDLTNHRIMWLLIVQGLIANAFVSAIPGSGAIETMLAPLGILVTLSAFVILYKSYQARGYLQFLGVRAKKGTLREDELPLAGWPTKRIKGWRKTVWICPWFSRFSDLIEPYLFLPGLLILAWMLVLLRRWLKLGLGISLVLSTIFMALILSVTCRVWVWAQEKDEQDQQP